jgi:hypothetical protein
VPHVFEPAPSGRAKCRGCNQPIGKGEVRFGERLPNPFGDGEATLWFHPLCAAWKRPEPLLETLAAGAADVPERATLERAAQVAAAHRRVPRIDGAEKAPSGRAACRHCKQPIGKGEWRIRLVFFEDGRFDGGGSVHLGCRQAYFEVDDVLAPVLHFSPALTATERDELVRELTAPS